MASMTLRCCQAKCDPGRFQKLLPDARKMSATSRLAGSSLDAPSGMLDCVSPRYIDGIQRTGNRLQMASRQMQTDRRISELGMSEQLRESVE
jgi:hypothetical protein